MLGAPIIQEEIRRALFCMGNYKAPGLMVFILSFFKSKWDILGPSICKFVVDVFNNPHEFEIVNHTLLTLIPKLNEPERASDFRPIAVCNASCDFS